MQPLLLGACSVAASREKDPSPAALFDQEGGTRVKREDSALQCMLRGRRVGMTGVVETVSGY